MNVAPVSYLQSAKPRSPARTASPHCDREPSGRHMEVSHISIIWCIVLALYIRLTIIRMRTQVLKITSTSADTTQLLTKSLCRPSHLVIIADLRSAPRLEARSTQLEFRVCECPQRRRFEVDQLGSEPSLRLYTFLIDSAINLAANLRTLTRVISGI